VPQYLVEVYHSKTRPDEALLAAERARAAAEEIARDRIAVRYVRSHFLREDETFLYLFEAPSAGAVREACRRAGIAGDRIVEASDITVPDPRISREAIATRPRAGCAAERKRKELEMRTSKWQILRWFTVAFATAAIVAPTAQADPRSLDDIDSTLAAAVRQEEAGSLSPDDRPFYRGTSDTARAASAPTTVRSPAAQARSS
jgi:hypothetical protein